MTSLLLFPAMLPYAPTESLSMTGFGLLILNEVLLGTIIGLISQMVFAAVGFGGTVIGYQMGFAAANIFDPQTTQQLSLISQFVNILALLAFLSLDIHQYYFRAVIESYRLLPPGFLDFSGGAVQELMRMASRMFVLGVQFSAPVLALLLLANMVLGILARVFPQLNVFVLSFPLNIGIAFLVMGLTLGASFSVLRREFDTMMENILTLMTLLH
jgi:flagellar biosynthetic protein FliR